MSGWLKAGLIGAAVLVVLDLISLIPFLVCITLPLMLVTYIVVGVLAASYMPPIRDAGKAAGEGALAGLIASIAGGIVGFFVSLIQVAMGGAAQSYWVWQGLPSEVVRELQAAGVPPSLVTGVAGLGGVLICGSICCAIGVVLAAALGALSATLYAAVKPE